MRATSFAAQSWKIWNVRLLLLHQNAKKLLLDVFEDICSCDCCTSAHCTDAGNDIFCSLGPRASLKGLSTVAGQHTTWLTCDFQQPCDHCRMSDDKKVFAALRDGQGNISDICCCLFVQIILSDTEKTLFSTAF